MIASAITKTEENQLKFFFTPQGFTMDFSEEQIYDKALDKWVKKFKKDKFQAVYDVGFEKSLHGLTRQDSFCIWLRMHSRNVLPDSPTWN